MKENESFDLSMDFDFESLNKIKTKHLNNNILIKQKAIKRILKNEQIHLIKAKALLDLIKMPLKNEQYRIITEKQFNAYAVILNILKNELIEEMYLAIYRINQPTVYSLIDFIESQKIKKATFIISSFFNQTKVPEKWALILKDFSETNEMVNFIYTHNHAKVYAAATNKNNYYVFEGSGNMSDNARIEQYIFENNKRVFDFHKEWMSTLIKNHGSFKNF